MFDTHCHLNFGAFDGMVDQIVSDATRAGVSHIVVPATDLPTSQKAVKIANEFENVYAAVGIHPHHIFQLQEKGEETQKNDIVAVEALLADPKVVAVGEVGLDRHYYSKTKYTNYDVTSDFVKAQIEIFAEHVTLALKHNKTLIIHHREAKEDFLASLPEMWDSKLARRSVIHCCEPDRDFLSLAQKLDIFIGVDGDVTYDRRKMEFIKEVPLERLVLETDAPFLTPEPHRSKPRDTRGPNVPANLPLVAEKVAALKGTTTEEVKSHTFSNAIELFQLSKS